VLKLLGQKYIDKERVAAFDKEVDINKNGLMLTLFLETFTKEMSWL
jgi:hypothetical protein